MGDFVVHNFAEFPLALFLEPHKKIFFMSTQTGIGTDLEEA